MSKASSLPQADQLRKSVFDRFYWDSRVDDFSNINVEISEGKVTLSGSVPSYPTRKYAALAAAGVPGVASVDNRLAIKYSDNLKIPSDREIETRIQNIIRWNSNIDESRLQIRVNAGYATLEGSVCSFFQKFRAQELAADVIGVLDVDNRLAVIPVRTVADEDIASNVIRDLKNRLGTDADAVTVMVKDGIVTLTGTVPDMIAFHAAENVVHHLHGIVDLHNHLATARIIDVSRL